jgi:hypothetical protein
MVRKTLISTVLWLLFDFLPLKNDVKVPSKSNMQKSVLKKIIFGCHLEGQWWKKKDPHPHPDPNPDPLVRSMDPRIRIHTKMSLIHNTALQLSILMINKGGLTWNERLRCWVKFWLAVRDWHLAQRLQRLRGCAVLGRLRRRALSYIRSHSCKQGCGSGLDPDSIGSVDPDRNPDPDQGGKKWPTKVENFVKNLKVHVLKCWMASFENWRLLLNLDVLYGGLGIGKL